jgi:hypothetical protein
MQNLLLKDDSGMGSFVIECRRPGVATSRPGNGTAQAPAAQQPMIGGFDRI